MTNFNEGVCNFVMARWKESISKRKKVEVALFSDDALIFLTEKIFEEYTRKFRINLIFMIGYAV